ncbi:hypothetical protein QTG56_15630 [Rossellomorea sp. AcN35-11]|nr:hypothetical protein [Rossellomorea aquimaris]WJV28509.1 hypothetical protein QTG56_15630 [Rossellomorea sp. AcN35-11]
MYERRNIQRKNLLSLLTSTNGLPNLGTGYDNSLPNGYLGSMPPLGGQGGNSPVAAYNQFPSATNTVGYGQQGYPPPPGFPQAGYGPPPYGPAGGYGFGINPLGAGLIGLGIGFLGGQIVNSPFKGFKGPYKRCFYYL